MESAAGTSWRYVARQGLVDYIYVIIYTHIYMPCNDQTIRAMVNARFAQSSQKHWRLEPVNRKAQRGHGVLGHGLRLHPRSRDHTRSKAHAFFPVTEAPIKTLKVALNRAEISTQRAT